MVKSVELILNDFNISKQLYYSYTIISLVVTNDFDKITEYEKYNYDSGFGLKM